MKEKAYNKDRDQDHKSLTTKSISFDLMKECHNELTSEEIVSLKIMSRTMKLEQENDHLFELFLSQDIVHICVNSLASRNDCREMQQGIKSLASASRSQPSGNTKKNKISQTTSSNPKNKVKDHPRSVKSSSNKKNRVIEPICDVNVKHTKLNVNSEVVQIVLWYLDSGCSKNMTGNHSQLTNFVYEFLDTARFKNDLIAKIIGYGDYQMGKVMISQKPDLSYLHVFGALFYPTNDSEDLGKLKPKADIGIFVGYAPAKKAFRIYNKRTRLITETIHVDFDELTTMFSEQFSSGPEPQLLTPGTIIPTVIALVPADSTGSPYSTSVDQDAPSPSTSQTPHELQSLVVSPGVVEDFHDIEVAYLDYDPFFSVSIPEPNSKESSSRDVIPTNLHSVIQPPKNLSKWTKDHPLDNVTGNPSRPISRRHQLQNKALFYYSDAFLSFTKPKNYKEALKEACWIKVVQE
ncbi:retrovirus-related pol polyprotein from transposon TNT 1-94 [Tanacetum coccineum]|uniref:Retrovirus-related pol polyprotein from transposon TNT 1-94 n=1 Tax=Tanacetum coccineum TaxID=301880 RepID=A0ABQ5CA61_9ASTR